MDINPLFKQPFLSAISAYPQELKLLLYLSSPEENTSFSFDWSKMNWNYFLELIDRHRLISLVYKNSGLLKDNIPTAVQEAVSLRYQDNTHRMLLITAEMVRIGKIISSKNIFFLFVKGPIWSLQLYGNIAARQSRIWIYLFRMKT